MTISFPQKVAISDTLRSRRAAATTTAILSRSSLFLRFHALVSSLSLSLDLFRRMFDEAARHRIDPRPIFAAIENRSSNERVTRVANVGNRTAIGAALLGRIFEIRLL